MEAIRILIVDDHPVVREGLSAMLSREKDFQVVGEAENGAEAIEKAYALQPNLILMDLRMPKVDGVEAMKRIRINNPNIKFIILTTYDDDEYIFKGIEAGARAYLLKDTPRNDLFRAIKAVLRKESIIDPSIAGKVLDRFTEISRKLHEPTGLSEREIEVLKLMAKGKENKEIGVILTISESTVKTHIQSIFQRLGVDKRVEAVTEAIKKGIILP